MYMYTLHVSVCVTYCTRTCTFHVECGGELYGSGNFQSPNYPNSYPHSRNCVWKLRARFGRRITLTINDLDLEHHDRCQFDFLAASFSHSSIFIYTVHYFML